MKLLFLLWILPLTLGDNPITCIYSKECVLPCTSKHKNIIHWYYNEKAVHSYFYNKDQLGRQSQEYRGRTSLSPEIINGNLSLLLRNIRVQDEGRYKCYGADDTSNEETFVMVSVEAQVKSAEITLKGDTFTCSASGVYPKPNVLWTSSNSLGNEPNNIFSSTEEKLITVTSKLKVDDISKTYNYTCTIISEKDQKTLYTAILEQDTVELPVNGENCEFTFKCPVLKGTPYTLTFTFDSHTFILEYKSDTSKTNISDQWKGNAHFNPENGNIQLSHLNEEHLGTYTCDITTAQERYRRKVTLTSRGVHIPTIIVIVIIAAIIVGATVLLVIFRNKFKCNNQAPY